MTGVRPSEKLRDCPDSTVDSLVPAAANHLRFPRDPSTRRSRRTSSSVRFRPSTSPARCTIRLRPVFRSSWIMVRQLHPESATRRVLTSRSKSGTAVQEDCTIARCQCSGYHDASFSLSLRDVRDPTTVAMGSAIRANNGRLLTRRQRQTARDRGPETVAPDVNSGIAYRYSRIRRQLTLSDASRVSVEKRFGATQLLAVDHSDLGQRRSSITYTPAHFISPHSVECPA